MDRGFQNTSSLNTPKHSKNGHFSKIVYKVYISLAKTYIKNPLFFIQKKSCTKNRQSRHFWYKTGTFACTMQRFVACFLHTFLGIYGVFCVKKPNFSNNRCKNSVFHCSRWVSKIRQNL